MAESASTGKKKRDWDQPSEVALQLHVSTILKYLLLNVFHMFTPCLSRTAL